AVPSHRWSGKLEGEDRWTDWYGNVPTCLVIRRVDHPVDREGGSVAGTLCPAVRGPHDLPGAGIQRAHATGTEPDGLRAYEHEAVRDRRAGCAEVAYRRRDPRDRSGLGVDSRHLCVQERADEHHSVCHGHRLAWITADVERPIERAGPGIKGAHRSVVVKGVD